MEAMKSAAPSSIGFFMGVPTWASAFLRWGGKVNALRFGFRFFRGISLAPPFGGEVGAPGGHALPVYEPPFGGEMGAPRRALPTGL